MNKVYEGIRTKQGCEVTVNGQPLNLRNDLRDLSPEGVEWGYPGGSRPAQLALSLLADALGNDQLAQEHYQHFERAIVAGLDHEQWILTQAEIRCWLGQALAARPDDPEEDDEIPF